VFENPKTTQHQADEIVFSKPQMLFMVILNEEWRKLNNSLAFIGGELSSNSFKR